MFRTILLLTWVWLTPALADVTADQPAPPTAVPAPGPVATLAAALQLYTTAEAGAQALEMAAASRLAQSIRLRSAGAWQLSHAPGEGSPVASVANPSAMTLDLLLSDAAFAAAELMAEEDEALSDYLAMLPPVSRQGSASRKDAQLAPATRDIWQIPFDGQSPAEIAVFFVSPPAPGALLWQVSDPEGAVICPWQDAISAATCAFTPDHSAFYQIITEGRSKAPQDYALITN